MTCPTEIINLAKEILAGKKEPADSAVLPCSIQHSPIKGILIIEKDNMSDNNFVTGEIATCWLLDKANLTETTFTKQKFTSPISSDIPYLYFCRMPGNHYCLNYICGPRAGRGFVAKSHTTEYGYTYLKVAPEFGNWIS